MLGGVTLALLIVVVCLLWGYFRWKYSYWSSRGVPSLEKPLYVFGHSVYFFFGDRASYVRKAYNNHKNDKVVGYYDGMGPGVFVIDPTIVKQVLVKDFDSFSDRRHIFPKSEDVNEENNILAEMLSAINGKDWKKLRSTMSPTFSSGKMKNMFSIVNDQSEKLVAYCAKFCQEGMVLDAKEAFGRFTMDVISASAFGIDCGSLTKEDAVFAQKAEALFGNSLKSIIKSFFAFMLPNVGKALGISFIDDNWRFFMEISKQTITERRKATQRRGDFLDLILEEQEKQTKVFDEEKDYKITDRTILSESVLFLIAGYDTTANAISCTTHYLSKNKDAQKTLREELYSMLDEHGQLDYHEVMEAKYLDACVNETLRLSPALSSLERYCTKDTQIPETDITIKEGMMVQIPLWGFHRDPEFWPEPDEFQPERFLPENKSNIVPFTYMPFGLGPRNCIAMRFALMEAKMGIAKFVMAFDFSLASKEGEQLKLINGGGVLRPAKECVSYKIEKVVVPGA